MRISSPARLAAAGCLILQPSAGADEPVSQPGSGSPASAGPGFVVSKFAGPESVKNPTALAVADSGEVYVCETWRWTRGVEDNRAHTYWIMDDLAVQNLSQRRRMLEKWNDSFPPGYFTTEADRIVKVSDRDGDGIADESVEFAGGFRDAVDGPAIGVLPALNDPSRIYFTCSPKLWLLTRPPGRDDPPERHVLADGFGIRTSLSGHDLHGLVWGPDGYLYFSMGDRGFHVVTKDGVTLDGPDSGGVFRCRPDGSGMEQVCSGLRNPQELAFNEFGDLFTVDNNCDQGDLARICWLLEGSESGWHIGHQALTTYKPFLETGGITQPPHWLSENLWKTAHDGQPLWITPPIGHLTAGPSGFVFTSGISLPDRYRNSFFICDYKGAPAACFLYSFRVVPDEGGYSVQDAHLFHEGVPNADVDIGPDGRIYLLDFGGGWARSDSGNIYAISWQPGLATDLNRVTSRLLQSGLASLAKERLLELLGHADQRVRLRAQYALAARGPAVVDGLSALVRSGTGLAQRHAIWALGQLNEPGPLLDALNSGDPEVRAQAARTLGTMRAASAAPRIRPLLADDYPRARIFAAIALGRLRDSVSAGALIRMIETRGTANAFHRQAGVMGLAGCLEPQALRTLSEHPSPDVRLSAVLALRRLRDPGCAAFLTDGDSAVSAEALRAIADLPIPAALPSLTDEARRIVRGDAPPHLLTDVHFRRILRGLAAEGSAYSATALAELAADLHLPEPQRILAIRTLRHFSQPPPIDPTTGLWRPLPKRDPAPIRDAVQPAVLRLLDAPAGALTPHILELLDALELTFPDDRIATWATDPSTPEAVRIAAIRRVTPDAAANLLDDPLAAVRIAAAQRIAEAAPEERSALARQLMRKSTAEELRAACRMLESAPGPEATAILADALDRLAGGSFPEPAAVDLLEACASKDDPELKRRIGALEAKLAATGGSVLDYTLTGGDPARGAEVFANQGTCLKCHRIEGAGGNAGPKLAGLALREKPAAILQSLTEPNAVITPGYGMTVVTLEDETIIAGTPIEDLSSGDSPADLLVLRTPEGAVERIEKSRIREQSPPVSPMPPLGLSLSRRDLRDLMAYLLTLDTPPAEIK